MHAVRACRPAEQIVRQSSLSRQSVAIRQSRQTGRQVENADRPSRADV